MGTGEDIMVSDKVLYRIVKRDWEPIRKGDVRLALDVRIGDRWLGYHDTQRGHELEGHLEKETKDGFIWRWVIDMGKDGKLDRGRIHFRAVTLEEYDREIRPKVFGNVPQFETTEDLYEFYRREFGSRGFSY